MQDFGPSQLTRFRKAFTANESFNPQDGTYIDRLVPDINYYYGASLKYDIAIILVTVGYVLDKFAAYLEPDPLPDTQINPST